MKFSPCMLPLKALVSECSTSKATPHTKSHREVSAVVQANRSTDRRTNSPSVLSVAVVGRERRSRGESVRERGERGEEKERRRD